MDSRLSEMVYLMPDLPVENCLLIDPVQSALSAKVRRFANDLQIIEFSELDKLAPHSKQLIGNFNQSVSPASFFRKSFNLLDSRGACFAVVNRRNAIDNLIQGALEQRLLAKMVVDCGYQDVRLYGIAPSIADPRLLVPVHKKSRLTAASLGLYQPSLPKAKMRKGLSFILGFVGLARLWTPHILLIGSKAAYSGGSGLNRILAPHYSGGTECALFTGTPGELRKPTLQIMDQRGAILGYAKIAAKPELERLLDNEAKILETLQASRLRTAETPFLLASERLGDQIQIIVLSTTKKPFSSGPAKLTTGHLEFLVELFNGQRKDSKIGNSSFYNGLIRRLTRMDGGLSPSWKQIFEAAIKEISKAIHQSLPFGMAHRDFTPWNTYAADGKLNVFDWEFARKDWPPLIDPLHFILQKGVVVEKQTHLGLSDKILSSNRPEGAFIRTYLHRIGVARKFLKLLMIFYLVDIAILYLEKHSRESAASINDQALLRAWQGLLSGLLAGKGGITP